MSATKPTAPPSNVDHLPCLLNTRIGNHRFHLHRRLASGRFSIIYQATDLNPRPGQPHRVAVKCLAHKTPQQRRRNLLEVALHRRAAHLPGVVDFYDALEENGLLFLILQYCESGDLFSLITEDRLFLGRDDLIKNAFAQLLQTVCGLHSMGIYHRDLKPENVLSTHKGARLLIADFGLATLHIKSSAFGSGSCFYMTPEYLAGYYFPAPIDYSTRAADIWALAIIFINLITARSPWECAIPTDPSFAQYLRNPLWLRQILPISRPAFSFVNRIFFKHGIGITHRELRDRFYSISTFCIPSEELPFTSKTARAIAEERRRTESSAKSDTLSEVDYYEDGYCEDADKTLVDDSLQYGDKATVTDDMKHLRLDHSAQLSASSRTSSASWDSDLLITPENAATRPVDIIEDIGGDDDIQDFLLDVEQARHHGLSKQKHKRACVRFASRPEYADID